MSQTTRKITVREFLAHPVGIKRLALVSQGGGLRGVYSMGAMAALEDAGLRNAFDVIVGSSAGAINGAYFLSGLAHEAVDIYVEQLSNRHFADPLRLHKIVDIDYLVDVAFKQKLPLNLELLTKAPTLLEVIVTNAKTGKAEIVTNRDHHDFYEVLRATAALPSLYNRKIWLGGQQYVDGGVVNDFPVLRAMEQGADAVLAIPTQRPGYRRHTKSSTYRTAARLLARGQQSHAVVSRIGVEDELFNRTMAMLEGKAGADEFRGCLIWPSDSSKLVSRETRDKDKLRRCADMGYGDMERLLDSELDPTWSSRKTS